MQKHLYILFVFGLSITTYAQNRKLEIEKALLEHFQKHSSNDANITRDSLYFDSFLKNEFNVSVSDNLIQLDTAHIVIKNPYYSEKYEDAEEAKDYTKNYPKSFSVIYQDHLISLFENGKFATYNLQNFERNLDFENKLNTKKFKYHWIIGDKLGAFSGNSVYVWNENKWNLYDAKFPLKNQPKLFEDNEFIVFGDCHGEWGGTVYFFEKSTSKIFFTESTCANSVTKTDQGYHVLAHLGHGFGSSEIKLITDPRNLTLTKPNAINKTVNGDALGYTDKSNAYKKLLDLYGVQIFSSFKFQNRKLYIVNLSDLTFIAEIEGNEIKIVHPLFFNNLYTHDPITTVYGDHILMNLDFYGTGLEREVSVLIINGNRITKVDWNENHSR